mmetsp:Transcript_81574/g.205252  ORF Transcript_81574/g.205252 Transcript_81574/m.205252 type:complete len:241 (-) Transcript_81574:391-1113(-)
MLQELPCVRDPRGAAIIPGWRHLPVVIVGLEAEPRRLHVNTLPVLGRILVEVPNVVCLLSAMAQDRPLAMARPCHDDIRRVGEMLCDQELLRRIEVGAVLQSPAHGMRGCLPAEQQFLEHIGKELASAVPCIQLHGEATCADAVQGTHHPSKLHSGEYCGVVPRVVHLQHVGQQLRREVPIHVAALPHHIVRALPVSHHAGAQARTLFWARTCGILHLAIVPKSALDLVDQIDENDLPVG